MRPSRGLIVALAAVVLMLPGCGLAPPAPAPGAGDRPDAAGGPAEGNEAPQGLMPGYSITMDYELRDLAACGPSYSETEKTLDEFTESEIWFDPDHPFEGDIVYAGTGTVEIRETFTLNLCEEWMPPEGAEPCEDTMEWFALATVTATVLTADEATAFNVEDPDPDRMYLYFWHEANTVTITDDADCDRPSPDASSIVASPGRAVPLPEEGFATDDTFVQETDAATAELGIRRTDQWQVEVEPLDDPAP